MKTSVLPNSVISESTTEFHGCDLLRSSSILDTVTEQTGQFTERTEPFDQVFLSVADRKNLTGIQTLLVNNGYTVQVTDWGESLLNTLKNRNSTVLIDYDTDQSSSSIDLCKAIHTQSPETLVVALDRPNSNSDYRRLMSRYTFSYLIKPCDTNQILGAVFQANRIHRLLEENRVLKERVGFPPLSLPLPALSCGGQILAQQILTFGKMDTPVLINGEYGTGKRIVAQSIHQASSRTASSFEVISCETLPDIVLEKVLYEKLRLNDKGSGRFETSSSGTILLDHIEDMPRNLQPELIRLLKNRTKNMVQHYREETVPEVRVLFSTRLGLARAVALGRIREELALLLQWISLRVPPLRDRKEDIPLFCQNILARMNALFDICPYELSKGAIDRLLAHNWPGNIRELESVLCRSIEKARGRCTIQECDILFEPYYFDKGHEDRYLGHVGLSLEEIERLTILETLRKCGGKLSQTAEMLGICRQTLGTKIRTYRLQEILQE